MREAQKIEGLRSTLPTSVATLLGVLSELNEPGLVGVYFQFEASESLFDGFQKVLRVPLVLKPYHEIIGVPHDDCVASDLAAAPLLLEPKVEDIVQVDVRQDW